MSRTLATVQKIEKIEPIAGADKIEKATVLGWELVVKKGEFSVGDLCIYIEIDSILPDEPQYEFMRARKFRVRTIKLRGQVSQGLCLPLTEALPLGTDVTEKLGIRKYDPEGDKERLLMDQRAALEKNRLKKFFMRSSLFRKVYALLFKKNRSGWPCWIAKTDEERIQKCPNLLQKELRYDVTEKLDGQSGTYFCVKKGWRTVFGVCSRNFQLGIPDNSTYWRVANKYELKKKLAPGVVLQGEILAPNVQGNKYRVGDVEFYAFNLLIKGQRVSTEEMCQWCAERHIPVVPILQVNTQLPETVAELVEMSKGRSVKNPEAKREGIVCRNYEKRISFKVINPDFLLEQVDE